MVLDQQVALNDIEKKLGDPEVIATWSDLAKVPPNQIPGGVPRIRLRRAPPLIDNLMLAGIRGCESSAGTMRATSERCMARRCIANSS
jgi:hypothetical protein